MFPLNAIPRITPMYPVGMATKLTPGEWLEDQLARPDINMTQEQFGDAVGVGQSTVSGWIQGRAKPQRRTCQRIAEVLGITRDDVFGVFGIHRRGGQPINYSDKLARVTLYELRGELVDIRTAINAIIARIDEAQSDTIITTAPKE